MPKTWRMVKLGVCLHRRKETVLPVTLQGELLALVGLEDIQDGGRGGITVRQARAEDVQSLKTRFTAGDILYGKLRPYLNKVGIAPQAGLCSTEIWAFTTSPWVDPRYATFFLSSSFFVDRIASLTKGANLPRLDASTFDSLEIPLPPLSEQQRIVEVLQEAEKVRRLRAEAEVKTAELMPALFYKFFGDGRQHGGLPLHTLADVVSGVALGRKFKGMTDEVPYLRVANVQAGYLDLSEIKVTPATEDEIGQYMLKNGDVLLTEGGDFDKLGRGCLWEGQVEPCIHQNHVFRVRPIAGKLNSHFFTHYLQSPIAKYYFLRCAKRTTNLASINLTQLKELPVPNISIDDQEDFESLVQALEEYKALNGDKTFSELTRSLLAHAFSGQLTADLREAHKDQLTQEAYERDDALKEAGASLLRPRRTTMQEQIDELLKPRSDGIYAELNPEQNSLLLGIKRMVGGVSSIRYFSTQQLSEYIQEGPLRRNPQAIESHLAVLAVRGIIIPVSREEQTEDTGEYVFGNAYRLPLEGYEPGEDEEGLPRIADYTQSREVERLAYQLKKERSLI